MTVVVVHDLGEVPHDLFVIGPPDPNGQIVVPPEPRHVTGVETRVLRLGEQHGLADARENQAADLGEIESLRKAAAVLRDREDLRAPVVVGQELPFIDGGEQVHVFSFPPKLRGDLGHFTAFILKSGASALHRPIFFRISDKFE